MVQIVQLQQAKQTKSKGTTKKNKGSIAVVVCSCCINVHNRNPFGYDRIIYSREFPRDKNMVY